MTDVDERIVQMNFDNKQFERGVSETLGSIKDLKKGLDFKGATKGLENIDRSAAKLNFSSISNGVSGIAQRFSVLGIVGMTVIQDLTRAAFNFGKQLVTSMTLKPMLSGFSEYETQINAIQTILANTSKQGTTLEDVTGALRILNKYADDTIYNFTEMTRNIGTFTAAGVELDVSVAAIKGIANLAAVSGSNSQQASTAMYQLSQALSTGVVKLMDWNSVVNAGMGGAVFKDSLQETARVHGVAIDDIIAKEGSFRDSLSTGWLTKDILLETLAKFTGDLTQQELEAIGYTEEQIKGIQELGTMANDAATKVKTLTQLRDTLAEAAQSGWTLTWELIVGDFDEAKALFTIISEALGSIIGRSADARNSILQGWRDLGGREKLINAITTGVQNLSDAVKPIGEAFREIFPAMTADRLYGLTVGLETLANKIKMGELSLLKIKVVFKGVFAFLDIGRMLLVDFLKSFSGLSGPLKLFGGGLEKGALEIAKYGIALRESIIAGGGFGSTVEKIREKIRTLIEPLKIAWMWIKVFVDIMKERLPSFDLSSLFKNIKGIHINLEPLSSLWSLFTKSLMVIWLALKKVLPILGKFVSLASEGFEGALDVLTKALDNFDLSRILNLLNSGLIGGMLLSIRAFFKEGGSAIGGFSDVLDGLGDTLKTYQNSLKSKILLNIAAAIAILAVSIAIIGSVDSNRVASSLGAITVLMTELMISMAAFGKTSAGVGGTAKMVAMLLGVTTALLLISASVKTLSTIDPDGLIRGLFAIGAILLMLKTVMPAFSGAGISLRSAVALGIIAGAINLLTLSIFAMGKMDTQALIQGIAGLTGVLAVLAGFTKIMSTSKSFILAAGGIYVLSAALLLLSGVIFLLGSMKLETLYQGLGGLAGSLLIIAGAMHLMPGNLPLTAAGLLGVSVAMVILAGALRSFGSMSWEELTRGLIGLAASLGIIALGLYAMSGTIPGSLALIIASGALVLLADALSQLGKLSFAELGMALLAIAAAMGVLGIASYLLTPVIPSLFALAAALALLGVATVLAGAGILALSIGLTALGTGGAAGITALVLAIGAIINLIPLFFVSIGKGIIAIVQTLADGSVILVDGIVAIAKALLKGIKDLAPDAIEVVLTLLELLLSNLAEKLPSIIQAGVDILLSILKGIRDNIAEIVIVSYEIVENFLDAVSEKLPDIIDAGFDLMVSFIDGLADSVERNIPRLMDSVAGLGGAIVRGVLQGLRNANPGLVDGVLNLGRTILSTFTGFFRMHSPSRVMSDQSENLVSGLVGGLVQYGALAYDAVRDFGQNLVDRFSPIGDGISSILNSDLDFMPEIIPVIDLSDVRRGADTINSLLSESQRTGLDLFGRANDISLRIRQNRDEGLTEDQPVVQEPKVQFIQHNNSPKALSRIELWRQTRNLLLEAEGSV